MKNLRGTFNNLVSTMKRYDLYQKDDEVDFELNELSNIIDEVEKRLDCARRSNLESNSIVVKMTETFEGKGAIEDKITYGEFETLSRGVYDVDIALNFNNNEPIESNWYGLFEEPKRTIETEVSTETKVLIPKGSIVEWKETIQYYNVQGGAKARVMEDYTTNHESDDKTIQVEWLDEKARLQVSGGYFLGMFKEDFELPSVPTFLCHSDDNHNIVKDVIQKLKDIDVDGETMQYILEQVGMDGQMLRQLIMNSTETDTKDLLEEKRILSNQGKLV
jgi:hypothetical protein